MTYSGLQINKAENGDVLTAAATGFTNGACAAFNVAPATLTVSATGVNKVYDGTTNATVTLSDNRFSGDSLSDSYTSAAFADANAGTGKTVSVSGISISGTDAANYTLGNNTASTTANITPASTAGAVASSANPALTGATVWFTNTLSVVTGGGTPTGSVIFKDGATALGTNAVNGAGVAILSTSSLSHGSHTITAEYASNGNFTGTTNSLSPNQMINTPPAASSPTVTRGPGISLKVNIPALGTDADGDTLSVTALGAGSQGATITHNSAYVFYLPASGNNNNDSITYTISDGYGGAASGTITVNVVAVGGIAQSITVTNGVATIHFFGIPGFQYDLQRATSVNGTYSTVTAAGTQTAASDGQFSFTDSSAPSGGAYYRSIQH